MTKESVALGLIIALQYSLSISKDMSEAGQPWSSWTTRKIEMSKVLYKTVKGNHLSLDTLSQLPLGNTWEN